MPRILVAALILLLLFAGRLQAEVESWLFDPFDGARLSWTDRRFVQMALSMKGDYVGMLDGDWGAASQTALETYASREFGAGYASSLEVGALMLDVTGRLVDEGWGYSYFKALDLSLLTPKHRTSAAKLSDSGAFVDFNMVGGTLGYSLTSGDDRFTARLHRFTLAEVAGGGEPYTVRKPRLMIADEPAANLDSLQKSAIAMCAGATSVVGAVQDKLTAEQRGDLFANVKNIVTAKITAPEAIDSALAK